MKIQTEGHRFGSVSPADVTESGPIRAAISTETPVKIRTIGGDYLEVLSHTPDAVDLTRAAGSGLPLTVNHSERDMFSPSLPIGRVRNVAIEAGVLRGDLHFDTDAEGTAARSKMASGIAPDVSVTYQIEEHTPVKDGVVTATRWAPVAVSIVTVPADPAAGAGRSHAGELEAIRMPEEVKTPTVGEPADPKTIIETIGERTAVGYQAGAAAESKRRDAIDGLARTMAASIPALALQIEELANLSREDLSIDAAQFRAHLFDLIGGQPTPVAVEAPDNGGMQRFEAPGQHRRGIVTPGPTHVEKMCRGMEVSLLERAGHTLKPEEAAGNEFRGWSLLDMARECLEVANHSTRGWSPEQIARAAIAMGGARAISPGTANYVTADFPAVTENVITKRVHDGFMAAPVTWDRWCSTTEVPDFKQFSIPRLSQISDLPVVAENAAYTDLTQTDAKEVATLEKRGGLMSFSWEAIVNDDQRMFSRTSSSMGEAANRTIDKNVYALLVLNKGAGPVAGPVMGDTNQMFSGAHANVGTDALDLNGIVATRTRMARQTDDNSIELGIEMRFVIVPEELRDTADNLAGSEYLPWTEATPGAQRVNTVRSTFTVVPTIRLTDTTDWFAASAPGGTIEVAFLTGNRMPAVLRDQGWDTDALHWKIRQPSIAYPVDWRGLQWNEVAGA